MADEEYFPPRCCHQTISEQCVRRSLSPHDWTGYQAKAQEYALPLELRYYCPRPNCGRFLPRRALWRFLRTIRCPHCRHQIVNHQARETHRGKDPLAGDAHLDDTLRLSRRSGWRRCPRCRNMIERISGCRRMYCPCGMQLCYGCGARWGSCSCGSKHIRLPPRVVRDPPAVACDPMAPYFARRHLEQRRARLVAEVGQLRRSERQLRELDGERRSIETRLAALREDLARTGHMSAEILIVRSRITDLNQMWASDLSPSSTTTAGSR